MPIFDRYDGYRNYFQYGNTGKKYYYKFGDHKSRANAYFKALQQTKAIHSRKYNLFIPLK